VERIVENAQIFDFDLTHEDIRKIEALDCGRRLGRTEIDSTSDPNACIILTTTPERCP